MDRQTAPKARHHRLRRVSAAEGKLTAKARWVRLLGIAVLGACALIPAYLWDVGLEAVARPEFFRSPTPHEAYLLSLVGGEASAPTHPATSGLERAWEAVAYRAIDTPLPVGAAYREVGTFPSDDPQALGLRVHVPAGQRLFVSWNARGVGSDRVFLDLFRAAPDSLLQGGPGPGPRPALLSGSELEGGEWMFDAPETGDYVLRLQPELAGLSRYDLGLQVGAPWRFPVTGAGERDIGSFFGDAREGGSREHHGVDIFAPRGTLVVAAAGGTVRSVDTTEIGGRVVWQREAGGRHSLYYAHLDQPLVREGQRLRAGDTVGLVGNTGNARTTPPHLHFGVYRRGPQDPWNLIVPIPPALPEVRVSLELLGQQHPTSARDASLRSSSPIPARTASRPTMDAEVGADAAFRILAASGTSYRVVLEDGSWGFVDGRSWIAVPTPEGVSR